ncbi:MAG: NUDIX domain-containing protein [Pseudolabrys sp.]|jgi:ADP-ribose pyrophosphatase YjhB (NUDIX family)
MHFYWRFSRAATLGVRAMLIDGTGRIFLVKHSYVDGWHLPGGGVETGETLLEALTRELAEEGNIRLGAVPQLYGVYFNKRASRRDHVALFIVRDFRQDGNPKPNYEIIAHGFFPNDALPEDATRATRARVAEVFGGAAVSELW